MYKPCRGASRSAHGRTKFAPTGFVYRRLVCAKSNRARADEGIRPYGIAVRRWVVQKSDRARGVGDADPYRVPHHRWTCAKSNRARARNARPYGLCAVVGLCEFFGRFVNRPYTNCALPLDFADSRNDTLGRSLRSLLHTAANRLYFYFPK